MQFSLKRLLLAVTCFAVACGVVTALRYLEISETIHRAIVVAAVLVAVYLATIALALLVRKDNVIVNGLLTWLLVLVIFVLTCGYLMPQ